jgi:hypothetical protein
MPAGSLGLLQTMAHVFSSPARALAAFTLLVCFCKAPVVAQTATALPPKDKFYLVLLVGQSNMAGRGTVEEQDRTPHPRALMLNKAGEWVPATDPMHFDGSSNDNAPAWALISATLMPPSSARGKPAASAIAKSLSPERCPTTGSPSIEN